MKVSGVVHGSRHTAIRLLIVDDHAGVRRGVRRLLECARDIEIVGEAADGAEAVARARELRPDVVLMDAAMPRLDGIEATRRLVSANPDMRVIVLSALGDIEHETRSAGAAAHLLKDVTPARLLGAIRHAVAAPAPG